MDGIDRRTSSQNFNWSSHDFDTSTILHRSDSIVEEQFVSVADLGVTRSGSQTRLIAERH